MNVGILSMQRIVNYGSFLQSYALKKTIESLGHEVVFVDYKIEEPLYKSTNERISNKVDSLIKRGLDKYSQKPILKKYLPEKINEMVVNNKLYREEFLPLLGVTDEYKFNSNLDALVIGSDEVFNVFQKSTRVGYSLELLGKNNNAKRLLSYAASFGNTTLEKIEANNKTNEISLLLSDFDAISVRDANSGSIVKELTNKEPVYNLDPVLIYDFTNEIPDIVTEKDYIIVYAYRDRLSEKEKEEIIKFAQKKGKKLISLGGYQDFVDEYINASPFELLDYVKNADYIITDTFHGTIFSIIFQKKFVSFIRESKNGKYGNQEKMSDLLGRLGLSNRGIYNASEIEEQIEKDINYTEVNKIRKQYISSAIDYLKANLK